MNIGFLKVAQGRRTQRSKGIREHRLVPRIFVIEVCKLKRDALELFDESQ